MRTVYGSFLALVLTSGVGAQSYGAGNYGRSHDGGVPQATPPTLPAPIGLQGAGFYNGVNSPRVPYVAPIGLRGQAAGYTGINPGVYNRGGSGVVRPDRGRDFDHDRDRDRNRFGYVYGLPYFPIVYSSGSSYYDSAAFAPVDTSAEQTAQVTANLLGEQIRRLTAEVQALRSTQMQANAPNAVPQDDLIATAKPMVLVLRSGKKIEIQSYAIVDGVLWDFTKDGSQRIPLDSIDAAASAKATEEAGGAFPLAPSATSPK